MLFTTNTVKSEDLNKINNFFAEYENQEVEVEEKESSVAKYITSLVSNQYAKSVEDIANTKVGNSIRRRRNIQQIMQQSFFYGANRFGNNFIA